MEMKKQREIKELKGLALSQSRLKHVVRSSKSRNSKQEQGERDVGRVGCCCCCCCEKKGRSISTRRARTYWGGEVGGRRDCV